MKLNQNTEKQFASFYIQNSFSGDQWLTTTIHYPNNSFATEWIRLDYSKEETLELFEKLKFAIERATQHEEELRK